MHSLTNSLTHRRVTFARLPHRYVEVRPNNLDVELVLANTYICLPESQWVSTPTYAAIGGGVGGAGGREDSSLAGGGGGRAVVIHADVTFTQIWRGMPQVRGREA